MNNPKLNSNYSKFDYKNKNMIKYFSNIISNLNIV